MMEELVYVFECGETRNELLDGKVTVIYFSFLRPIEHSTLKVCVKSMNWLLNILCCSTD